jgi:hypothetical protein
MSRGGSVTSQAIRGVAVLCLAAGLLSARTAGAVTGFPLKINNYSGRTLLIVNEEDNNLVALPILNDGTVDGSKGVALANNNGSATIDSDPDGLAVTPDGKFAYVHAEFENDFYRFDLMHIDFHNDTHVSKFTFNDAAWRHDGLAVLNGFLYATGLDPGCDLCTTACTASLYKMAINPATGDLSAPTVVVAIDDGSGHVATGVNSGLATDGTCIYASDVGAQFFCPPDGEPTFSPGTSAIFQICGTTVKVWADTTTGGDHPGLIEDHTITFGPNAQNLFLSENNHVYSTTGLSGMTPGSFTKVGDLPGAGVENEGSAFLTLNNLQVLYVGNETEEEAYATYVKGSGSSIGLGLTTAFNGEALPDTGDTGDPVDFDEAEGLATIETTPRFSDGTALFANTGTNAPLVSSSGLIGCVALLMVAGLASLRRLRAPR